MTCSPASDLCIRPAARDDLGAINDIYNHYVLNSTATYQLAPETAQDRAAWFERHGAAHPVIVAQAGGAVVGWGSLSPYNPREAYARTVENSVYVRHDMHRRGIGSALLSELIRLARRAGQHVIIAGIDSAQAPSIALHARHGFIQVGCMRQVGHKHGHWLDVIYMQLIL
jgi:phosphinothricin acetyltransferase